MRRTLFLLILCLFLLPFNQVAADTFTDDFNDNFFNPDHWKMFDGAIHIQLVEENGSLNIESSELLECFQWKKIEDINQDDPKMRERVGDEIADILIYIMNISDKMGLDLSDLFWKKLKKNEQKYPKELCSGRPDKYHAYKR